jgi:hypothetical protein
MTHATDTHVAARTAFASARSRSRLHRRHRRRHHHWCGTTSPSAPVFAIAAAALAATNCISLAARIERFEVMGTRTNSQIPSRLRAQCVRSRDAKSVLPIGGDHAAVSPGRKTGNSSTLHIDRRRRSLVRKRQATCRVLAFMPTHSAASPVKNPSG